MRFAGVRDFRVEDEANLLFTTSKLLYIAKVVTPWNANENTGGG